MKNFKMDASVIDHPRPSSSPKGLEQLFKSQKFDTPMTSSLNISVTPIVLDPEEECRRLKTEVVALKFRLCESEETVTKLHRIRREIEEIFQKERIMLQLQVKMDTDMIEELRVKLNEATRSIHEALGAKKSVELKMSKMISELLMGNIKQEENTILSDSEQTPASREFQEDTESLAKLRIAEQRIIELEEKLEDKMISQTEFDLLNVEMEQLMNQKFKIEKTACEQKKILIVRVQELEEELKLSKNTISTLHDVVEEVELLKQRESENAATIVMLQKKNEELSSMITGHETGGSATPSLGSTDVTPSLQQGESIAVNSIEEQAIGLTVHDLETKINESEESREEVKELQEDVKNERSDIDLIEKKSLLSNDNEELPAVNQPMDIDNDVEILEIKSAEKSLEIRVGNHFVLVSDPEFFDINWIDEYKQVAHHRYSCKNCGKIESSSVNMEDHVWVKHYHGFFECPTCSANSQPFPLGRRDWIREHMVESHAHLFRSG